MQFEYTDPVLSGVFRLTDDVKSAKDFIHKDANLIHILWNNNERQVILAIDGIQKTLEPNQILTLTYYQVLELETNNSLIVFSFNREFYCIMDHDHEVSCNGVIFFGTQEVPIITIPESQQSALHSFLQVFIEEFNTRDNIQGEMLRMLLKRLIIICTRLAKEQLMPKDIASSQVEILRKFNVLVDTHFRTKKNVSEYADLLHKSPKTLSNLFKKYNQKSPLQIIHERIVLEAKRLMMFSDKQTRQIAYELGFDDPAHFSRFFKKTAKVSPSEFRVNPSKTI